MSVHFTMRATWLAVALAVLLAVVGSNAGAQAPAPAQGPVVVSADFSPRIVLFGDILTAHVDAVVDTSVVDPATVETSWDSAPWVAVGVPQRKVERAGSTAHVRTTYLLRCLTAVCAPARETERVDLDPATVAYTSLEGGPHQQSVDAAWPTLVLHTRIGELDSSPDALAAPWRADLESLPAVSYRLEPWLPIAILVVVGLALLAVAAVVVYRVWPRREAEPEPEPEPEPVASVLEQALVLLENEVSTDGVEERRRALELVADEVEHLGDEELALAARAMAWSPVSPEADRTKALAAELRVRFADVLAELEAERANGVPAGEGVNGGPP